MGRESDAALQREALRVAEVLRSQMKEEKLLKFLRRWQRTSFVMNMGNCQYEGISGPE